MNYNINSSGLYDVNAYNLIATNATVLSTLNVNGNILGSNNTLFNNPVTCVSSLNVSGNTTLNNITTCRSSLNVSGITTLSNNVVINGTSQPQPKILLSGTEFFTSGSNFTSSDGVALLLGVNRANNRQLWVADSTRLAINTANPVLRISNNSIDCMATDGTTRLPLSFGGGALTFNSNGRPILNKMLLTNALPADTKASIESLIFSEGGIISGVFGGDSILTGYWGVAVNLNYGGWTNGVGGGSAGQTYVPGFSAFTVNMRSSTLQTTFDRRLFTIMPDGNITTLSNINCGGGITINSTLNVSGLTTLSNNTTINGILNVSGNSNFRNAEGVALVVDPKCERKFRRRQQEAKQTEKKKSNSNGPTLF